MLMLFCVKLCKLITMNPIKENKIKFYIQTKKMRTCQEIETS